MTRVLHYFEPSTHGVPNYVAFLAEHQAKAGHDVEIIGPKPRDIEGVTWTDDQIRRRSLRSIRRSGRSAARVAKKMNADVIHAHSFFAGLAIRMAKPSQPVVYTPHAWAFERVGSSSRVALALERRLLRRTARILCVSQGEADIGMEHLGTRTPIVSIGSAVDLDRFSVDDSIDLEHRSHAYRPFVVCVGRISDQKGQLALAESWAKTMADHPLQLVFVGAGHPDIDPDDYPVSEGNVHFVGPSSDVPGWLRAAEFSVQPSRWEAMSLATVESLACGRPVIATDVAGMYEAVADGPLTPAGVVVPSIADVAPMARSVFDGPVGGRGFATIARQRAELLFSIERLVAKTDEEYAIAADLLDLTRQPESVVELRTADEQPEMVEAPIDLDDLPKFAA